MQCKAEYVSDVLPPLTCDKQRRFHLVHHDPATGVRYVHHPWGVFDLCGLRKHRDNCPLRA